MRISVFFTAATLLLASCSDNSAELTTLRRENAALQKEIFALRIKTEDAIVIPRKDINRHVHAVTFGPATVKPNEQSSFETYLVLGSLPKDIDVKWTSEPEPMSVKSRGIVYWLKNTYPAAGKRTFNGTYTLTFPNGKTYTFTWPREFEVND